MKRFAVLLLLLLPGLASAQKVTLPASITRQQWEWFIIPFEVDGGPPKWKIPAGLEEPPGLWNVFPPETLKALKGRIVYSREATKPDAPYIVEAWNAKGDNASDIARCEIRILPPGPVPPGPGPTPPGPTPPDPKPPVPVPATGFRVLFVCESSSNLTREQLNIWNSTKIATYLNAKAAKTNGKPDWRQWDKDINVDNENALLKQLWRDVKPTIAALPALVVVADQKATVYPLPATEQATLDLLTKIGGP